MNKIRSITAAKGEIYFNAQFELLKPQTFKVVTKIDYHPEVFKFRSEGHTGYIDKSNGDVMLSDNSWGDTPRVLDRISTVELKQVVSEFRRLEQTYVTRAAA